MFDRRHIICASALLWIACGGEPIDHPAGGAEQWDIDEPGASESLAPGEVAGPQPEAAPAEAVAEQGEFVVHEWGTFTAVQSSEGEYLEGLHHEEEALPPFVHQLEYSGVDRARASKGLAYLPEPVTQKMETPVIYFYVDEPTQIDVSVQFPQGVVSEWYPQAESWTPGMPMDRLAEGSMDWKVQLSDEPAQMVPVAADDIWAPSRQVPDAAYVSHAQEADKFIFYRGLGRFEPPFRVTNDGHSFTIANHSAAPIANAYLLDVEQDTGHIYPLGDIDGFDETSFAPGPKEAPKALDVMVREAKEMVAEGLKDTGLTADEARAMVETWSRSYFRTPGIRILYTVPRSWTDEILPLSLTPRPDEMVRTLVGRVEVLTPADERQAVEAVEEAYRTGSSSLNLDAAPRFSEPRVRRACQLVDDPVRAWCEQRATAMMHSVQQTRF